MCPVAVASQIAQRKGTVTTVEGAEYCTIAAEVPLDAMFGYSNDLRGATQGKGEYSMEYKFHQPAPRDKQDELIKKYQEAQAKKA
jgi:elongation factor G